MWGHSVLQLIKNYQVAIIATLAGALVLSSCTSTRGCPIRESEEALVNRVLDSYGKGKVSREQLRRSFDISIVYFPTMTCVGLNLKAGTAGGDETICFDRQGQEIFRYRNGD